MSGEGFTAKCEINFTGPASGFSFDSLLKT